MSSSRGGSLVRIYDLYDTLVRESGESGGRKHRRKVPRLEMIRRKDGTLVEVRRMRGVEPVSVHLPEILSEILSEILNECLATGRGFYETCAWHRAAILELG